jgi:hypothetical protein
VEGLTPDELAEIAARLWNELATEQSGADCYQALTELVEAYGAPDLGWDPEDEGHGYATDDISQGGAA